MTGFFFSVTLITAPIDDIFDEAAIRTRAKTLLDRTAYIKVNESSLPVQYVFVARLDNALNGERDHPFPPTATDVFSAGFWMIGPSREMFVYFQSVMNHYRRFDPHPMKQSLTNYAYRWEGAIPWTELDYKWSAIWRNLKDCEGKVVAMHEKLWKTGPDELRNLWWSYKDNTEKHYDRSAG